jgi:hypothetical protein
MLLLRSMFPADVVRDPKLYEFAMGAARVARFWRDSLPRASARLESCAALCLTWFVIEASAHEICPDSQIRQCHTHGLEMMYLP